MTTTAPRTRRDATENRAALLDAARVALNRDPEASLETIAAEAGLSRRSVYGHFANRDELLRELVTLGSGRVGSALTSITHPDPVVRLALIASHLWVEVENIRVMTVIAVRGPLRAHTVASLAPLRASVLAALTEAAEAGTVRTDIPPHRLARLAEDAILSALEETTRDPLPTDDGRRIVLLSLLGAIGFGWREAGTLIDTHAELVRTEQH